LAAESGKSFELKGLAILGGFGGEVRKKDAGLLQFEKDFGNIVVLKVLVVRPGV